MKGHPLIGVLSPPPEASTRALPHHTARVVAAVRAGRASDLFPPIVAPLPEGVLAQSRELVGDEDARFIAYHLTQPGFLPLVELIEALGSWAEKARAGHPKLFSRGVLDVTNAELFGPLLRSAFVCCAQPSSGARARKAARLLGDGFRNFFELFLKRLTHDTRAGVLRRGGYHGPITQLWANPDETHNGRQHVLKLQFRSGGALAYKPRPAGGEAILIREGTRSLFEEINACSPASGGVRMPTLRILDGRGPGREAYAWHQWVQPPRQWGVVRRAGARTLHACVLPPAQAATFWHRAGSLTAALFAFGAVDLFDGNLLVGDGPGGSPMAYPVDLELLFSRHRRLADTGMIEDDTPGEIHHVGFERSARWCTAGGPADVLFERADGALELRRRAQPWGRTEARSVIADTKGSVGFAAYLLPYLRGMFDVWTLLTLERKPLLARVRRASAGRFVRVLARKTSDYGDPLERLMDPAGYREAGGGLRYRPEERAQLGRLDVPYFFQRVDGGPLLVMEPPPAAFRFRAARCRLPAEQLPSTDVAAGSNLSFQQLAIALRDAAASAFSELPARGRVAKRGRDYLELHSADEGSVTFDWPDAGKRFTFSWKGRELGVHTR